MLEDRCNHLRRVRPEHVHAVADDCMRRMVISLLPGCNDARSRGYTFDLREAERAQHNHAQPTGIELPRPYRELRGRGKCVMVVVQLLSADEQPPRNDIPRRVVDLVGSARGNGGSSVFRYTSGKAPSTSLARALTGFGFTAVTQNA